MVVADFTGELPALTVLLVIIVGAVEKVAKLVVDETGVIDIGLLETAIIDLGGVVATSIGCEVWGDFIKTLIFGILAAGDSGSCFITLIGVLSRRNSSTC